MFPLLILGLLVYVATRGGDEAPPPTRPPVGSGDLPFPPPPRPVDPERCSPPVVPKGVISLTVHPDDGVDYLSGAAFSRRVIGVAGGVIELAHENDLAPKLFVYDAVDADGANVVLATPVELDATQRASMGAHLIDVHFKRPLLDTSPFRLVIPQSWYPFLYLDRDGNPTTDEDSSGVKYPPCISK